MAERILYILRGSEKDLTFRREDLIFLGGLIPGKRNFSCRFFIFQLTTINE